MDGFNHGTIHDPTQNGLMAAVIAALQIDDGGFAGYCLNLENANGALMTAKQVPGSDPYYWGYQNTVFLVKDQFGHHVTDYFIEFYGPAANTFWETLFHSQVIEDVHAYTDDNAYRALLIDMKTLAGAQPQDAPLQISLSATPDISTNEVGYSSFAEGSIGAITLSQNQFPLIFQPNRTIFIEITISRKQKPEIFQLGVQPPQPVAG
jgi:hypothetical protein